MHCLAYTHKVPRHYLIMLMPVQITIHEVTGSLSHAGICANKGKVHGKEKMSQDREKEAGVHLVKTAHILMTGF